MSAADNEASEQQQTGFSEPQQRLLKKMRSPFFRFYLLAKLPAAYWSGLRVAAIDERHASVSVPYGWRTQNPFRSTYFACLAMAAELSTGLAALLAIEGRKPSVSMLVIDLHATYGKKATTLTTFTCADVPKIIAAAEAASDAGEGVTVEATSIGRDTEGEEVARFVITWSFRARAPKV
ncbi:DUF4442 domain-containing protein [Gammaproteobacteria bacterium]|nr:DUF4442 domain-containing protein [Gammaproteobacteria bacterium]